MDLHKYLEDLQDEFIKLIAMSKGSITVQELRNYIDNIFKYDIKVKQ